jgi:hypothetical protein
MPGKEGSNSSSQEEALQQQRVPATVSRQEAAANAGAPESFSKQDWIDILAGALQKTSRSGLEKGPTALPQQEAPPEDDLDGPLEDQKVLGNLSSTIVESGGNRKQPKVAGSRKRAAAEDEPLADKRRQKASADLVGASRAGIANSAWKKKLLALQKAQSQLSSKLSALLDLPTE